MTRLNILNMTYISITLGHLFRSDRSPDFGTGTNWLLCQISKSYLSCQHKSMKSNTYLLGYLSMDLNVSGGTSFNTADFILVRPLISLLKYLPIYRVIEVPHCLSMFDKIANSVIVEYVLTLRLHDFNIICVTLGHYPIFLLHVHIICILMTSLLPVLQDINE